MAAVNLKQNPDGSMGLEGNEKGTGEFIFINIPYTTASPLTIVGAVAPRALVVQSIYGVTVAAASNAVTATCYKASSGTAIGSGTALHSGTFNLQATAATPAALTMSTTSGVTSVAAGQQIGVVISGALGAAGSGTITLCCAPA